MTKIHLHYFGLFLIFFFFVWRAYFCQNFFCEARDHKRSCWFYNLYIEIIGYQIIHRMNIYCTKNWIDHEPLVGYK